jgi:hypothetical protein
MNPNPNEKTTVDLDLNNYSLEDILALFQLQENFNEADLKRAKQQVLRLHPDKSRLDPKYFLFYSKAYKTVYSIWEFKNKNDNKTMNTEEYIPLDTSEENKKKALETFFDQNKTLRDANNFNKWFNEQFEKQKVKADEDEDGYGSWLKSNENVDDTEITNMRAMNEHFDKRKKEVRALVVQKDVQDITSHAGAGSNLLDGPQDNYSSDVFSSVGFQDLKQAHVESVIPVSNEDYDNTLKFRNVNEFVSYRNNQNTVPLSEIQAQQYLAEREKNESTMSTKRAYELAKQTEVAQEKNKDFWGSIMKIDNKR